MLTPDVAPKWFGLEPLEQRALLAAAYAVVDLGTLGGPSAVATDINEDRQVVGHSLFDQSPTTQRAFRWDADGGMRDLGVLDGFSRSEAEAINGAGNIVGRVLNLAFDERAFLWTPSDGITDLGSLAGPWSRAAAINDKGQIAGTSSASKDLEAERSFHAFMWENGVMTDLGTLGGASSVSKDINGVGAVVGLSQSTDDPKFRAFLFQNGQMLDLGTLGGPGSSANAINDLGTTVGDADLRLLRRDGFYRHHAVKWHADSAADLGTLGGSFSSATDINNRDEIVGWSQTKEQDILGEPMEHAFFYSNDQMWDLNTLIEDDQWILQRATAISDDGYISGYGTFSENKEPFQQRAFMLRPLFADLTVTQAELRSEEKIVPGERKIATATVANEGETLATGPFFVEVFLSPDQASGGADTPISRSIRRQILLRPGQSTRLRVPVEISPNLPPGHYHLAVTVRGQGFEERQVTNNRWVSEQSHELVWQFGHVGGRSGVRLSIADHNGQTLRFAMSGKGTGAVQATPDGLALGVSGSSGRSVVRIQSDDGAALSAVHIEGPLSRFDAADVDLTGSFSTTESIHQIILDDVGPSASMNLGGGPGPGSVELRIDESFGVSIRSQIPIASIEAARWHDAADGPQQIVEAPALRRWRVTGARRSDVASVVSTDLRIWGAGGESGAAVGTIKINGTIRGGEWSINGAATAIQAQTIENWQMTTTGPIGRISTRLDLSGEISAPVIGQLLVGRSLHDAALQLGPVTAQPFTLRRLLVGRSMQRVDIRSLGSIGVVSTGSADEVTIYAGIRDDLAELPMQTSDFHTLAAISRFSVRGTRGEDSSVLSTKIAAWSIGRIDVRRAPNGVLQATGTATLRVAAHEVRALAYRSTDRTLRLRRPDEVLALTTRDPFVRII